MLRAGGEIFQQKQSVLIPIFEEIKGPSKANTMEILLVLGYTAFFLFLIRKLRFFHLEGISSSVISLIFLLKVAAGIVLWAIYTYYYTDRSVADIYKYFDDSAVIFNAKPSHYIRMLFGIGNKTAEFNKYYDSMHYWARAQDSGLFNDSHTIIRFNALARLVSMGYYNVHTVFICFLSFTGFCAIYKTFLPVLRDKKRELFCIVFLLPSVLFWGSGVLKEGLIFFALGLFMYSVTRLFTLKAVIVCLSMAALLCLSKFYVWLCILPGLIFLLWMLKTDNSKPFLKYTIVLILFILCGLNIHKFSDIQDPLVTLSQKQLEFKKLASGQLKDSEQKPIPVAGSAIPLADLEPTLGSVLRNAPAALANVTFRPLPGEIRSVFTFMAGMENLLIIFTAAICLIFARNPRSWAWTYILFCLSFVVLQFIIIGETTPIIGAITRYRCVALPFLLICFLLVLDKNRINLKWKLYSKIFSGPPHKPE
jgi:hypothetical protein